MFASSTSPRPLGPTLRYCALARPHSRLLPPAAEMAAACGADDYDGLRRWAPTRTTRGAPSAPGPTRSSWALTGRRQDLRAPRPPPDAEGAGEGAGERKRVVVDREGPGGACMDAGRCTEAWGRCSAGGAEGSRLVGSSCRMAPPPPPDVHTQLKRAARAAGGREVRHVQPAPCATGAPCRPLPPVVVVPVVTRGRSSWSRRCAPDAPTPACAPPHPTPFGPLCTQAGEPGGIWCLPAACALPRVCLPAPRV